MIIKINEDKYIKFNEVTNTSEVLLVTELEERKNTLENRAKELEDYSDEALLAWAKKNFPLETEQKEKIAIDVELTHLNNNLNEIYGN
jgi:hypothetical protein